MTTDSFVVKPIRFPGGSIGELAVNGTVNDLAMAGARPLALTVALILEEGLDGRRRCAPRSRPSPPPREAAGVAIVAGDTKVVERGARRPDVHLHDGHRRARRRARRCPPPRCAPATACSSPGRIGDHGTAIMLARGEFELGADIESDTRSLWPRPTRCWTPPARACTACATRRAAAWPRCSTSWRAPRASRCSCARPPCRCTPRSPAPASCSGSTPCTWPTRACSWRPSLPSRRRRRWPRCARQPGGERAAEIGEVKTEPPGMVLVETAFGGRRVMDQLVGDPLPRIC